MNVDTDVQLYETTIKGLHFAYANAEEFYHTHIATFHWFFYRFRARTKAPLIIDCGAHIGISLLYFKQQYPQARVIGFEANPKTFKLLEQNVANNLLDGIELVQAAVSDQEGTISFYVGREGSDELTQWGDAGVKNLWQTSDAYTTITVPAVPLSTYINQPVDFIKLNIEGMEGIVLKEIEPKLHLVNELRIEFHGSSTNPENRLEELLSLLERHGFHYVLEQQRIVIGPTQIKRTDPYFLNVYTYRRLIPWLWHRYAWYIPSRVRFSLKALYRWLGKMARLVGIQR